MTLSPIRTVTISRQYGSGGSRLARAFGRLSGWRVVDREVVREVARTLHVPEAQVEARDESVPRLGDLLSRYLAGAFPELVPVAPEPEAPDFDAVAALSEQSVLEAAGSGRSVIVGHGGMCLLQGRLDVLHVRVTAPLEDRIGETMARLSMSRDQAEEEVQARDTARRTYIRVRFGRDWDDPDLFALTVNSRWIGPEAGARALLDVVRGYEKAAEASGEVSAPGDGLP